MMYGCIEQTLSTKLGREIRNPVAERILAHLAKREKHRLASVRHRYKTGKITRRRARQLGLKV